MKLQTVMIIKAAVCLVLGLLLVFLPGFTFSLFGATISGAATFPAQEYGAAMLGIMLLTWFSRNAAESQARRSIVLQLFVYDAIGVVITLVAIAKGYFNFMAWGVLLIYLFFTITYGYHWFARPAPAIKAASL